jgi:hypothetical protein
MSLNSDLGCLVKNLAKKSWSVHKNLKINRLLKKKNQGQQGSFQKEEPANTGSNLQKSI